MKKMKKMYGLTKLILVFIVTSLHPGQLNAQVDEIGPTMKNISTIKVEKQKMFPMENVKEAKENDTTFVQPPNQLSIDNPEVYHYSLDPQQVKSIFPEIVYLANGQLIIDYYSLFPIMLELMQDQQKQIDELKNQLEALKN